MSSIPVRLANCSPEGGATRRVLQRGGRVWVFRDVDGSPLGDRICTLPGVKAEVVVLAPRGFGRPLLARSTPSGWKGIPNGEPCGAERWRDTGGVAAWLHVAGAPYRPGPLLSLANAGIGSQVFTVWKARGLVGAEARANVMRLLEASGEASVLADGMTVELAGAEPRTLMPRLERVVLRLRPSMPDLRVGVAATEAAASGLADALEAGWIGLAPEAAVEAWQLPPQEELGMATGRRVGRWKGPALPDVDGLVSLCRSLSTDLPLGPLGGTVRVGLHGERGFCFFRVEFRKGSTSAQVAGQVAASVCEHFFQVGPVTAVSVALVEELAHPEPRNVVEYTPTYGQLALLPVVG